MIKMTRNIPTYEEFTHLLPFVQVPMLLDLCLSRIYQWKGGMLSGNKKTFVDDPNYAPMVLCMAIDAETDDPAKKILRVIKDIMVDGGCIERRLDQVTAWGKDGKLSIDDEAKEALSWAITEKGKKCVKEILDMENGKIIYANAQRNSEGTPFKHPAELMKAFNKSERSEKDLDVLQKRVIIKMQTENPIMVAFCVCMEAQLVNTGWYTWHNKDGFGYTGLVLTKRGKSDAHNTAIEEHNRKWNGYEM